MKSIGLKILILVVVVLMGCGHQDRYEVISPEVSYVVEDAAWGRVTALPTVHNNFDPSPAAVVDGKFYFGSRGGMVYTVTPTGYETLPRPEELFVQCLIEGPDGLLWRSDYYGNIFYFQNGVWESDFNLELVWDEGLNMLLDDQNRILLYGNKAEGSIDSSKRHLWRREASGQWNKQDVPGDPDIMHGWCEHGLPPVFLTKHLQLITEGPDGWEISDPILADITNEKVELQSSEDGQMAVRVEDYYYFLLNQGEGWEVQETNKRLEHLFWLNRQLYGIERYSYDLLLWNGTEWDDFLDQPSDVRGDKIWSRSMGSERILYFRYGESVIFDGTGLTHNTLPLGYPKAFVLHDGLDHLFMERGQHIQGTDGIWEVTGRPFDSRDSSDRSSTRLAMVVDDQDYLTFFGPGSVIRYTGSEYIEYPSAHSITQTFLQDDGKVVVFSEDQVGVWSGGELRWLSYGDYSGYDVYGARWETDERIQTLYRNHLRLIEPEQNPITLTFQGWEPEFMAAGPGQQLACAGRDRAVLVDGENISDITPIWGTTHGSPGRLSSIISDGLGGWIAFDEERFILLNFDGQKWYGLGLDFWSSIRYGGILSSNRDGTFLLQEYGYVFLIEPGVSP